MKIALIGFMGTGKSSVAHLLAESLSYSCIEMDEAVLAKTHCKDMAAVFAKGGELLLRETEIALAREYRTLEETVISTGGGVVLNKIILDYLKENGGIVLFLETSFSEIQKRIEHDETPRPLFQNPDQARTLYEFRLPLYRNYADFTITTDGKTPESIRDEILDYVKSQRELHQ